jgi:hypothetical protein
MIYHKHPIRSLLTSMLRKESIRYPSEVYALSYCRTCGIWSHTPPTCESKYCPVFYYLCNNIVLSMLYAEICPKVRRHNARPEGCTHYPYILLCKQTFQIRSVHNNTF